MAIFIDRARQQIEAFLAFDAASISVRVGGQLGFEAEGIASAQFGG